MSVTTESDPDGVAVDEVTAARTADLLSSERRKKREVLAEQGIDPYPFRFDRTAVAAELHERHDGLDPDTRTGEIVRLAGRITSFRGHGKLSFATVQDVSGSIQLLMQASVLSAGAATVLGQLDLGDWIGAEGEVVTSRRGELSVDVTELHLLSKSLRPLPDKWHGLSATDTRYRQREIDLLANPDSRQRLRHPVPYHRRPAARCWPPTGSSRSTPRSCSRRPVARWPGRSSPMPTPSTST